VRCCLKSCPKDWPFSFLEQTVEEERNFPTDQRIVPQMCGLKETVDVRRQAVAIWLQAGNTRAGISIAVDDMLVPTGKARASSSAPRRK
jgi:hypothetical protein